MFSERLFEDILVKYPELIEDNLKFIGRQVEYFRKRIDILFEDRFNEKLIIELKKDNLQRNALSQVMEYEGYILSEKDPRTRVMIIANRIPLNLKKAMDHHGIEYKEITYNHLLKFLESRDQQLMNIMLSQDQIINEKPGTNKDSLIIAGNKGIFFQKTGLTIFGHRLGSQAAAIDELLIESRIPMSIEEIAKELSLSNARIQSHLRHLQKVKLLKFEIIDNKYLLIKENNWKKHVPEHGQPV